MTSTSAEAMFGYSPSMPMAWIAGIVFTVSALVHTYQYFKHRAWYLYLMMLGIFMEVFGYWVRVIAVKNPENNAAVTMTFLLTTFVFSSLYFIKFNIDNTCSLAPSFLAAGCYMTFGRIIYYVCPESRRGFRQTWVPARFITILFIFLDTLSFCIQCIGIFYLIAKLSAQDQTTLQQKQALKTTYDILRVGFIMQITVFGLFMLLVLRFMFASKSWRFDWPEGGSGSWRTLGWTLVTAGLLITVSLMKRFSNFKPLTNTRAAHCTVASSSR